MLSTIFLLSAFILFLIAAWPVACRVNLVSAGLACYMLSIIISRGLVS